MGHSSSCPAKTTTQPATTSLAALAATAPTKLYCGASNGLCNNGHCCSVDAKGPVGGYCVPPSSGMCYRAPPSNGGGGVAPSCAKYAAAAAAAKTTFRMHADPIGDACKQAVGLNNAAFFTCAGCVTSLIQAGAPAAAPAAAAVMPRPTGAAAPAFCAGFVSPPQTPQTCVGLCNGDPTCTLVCMQCNGYSVPSGGGSMPTDPDAGLAYGGNGGSGGVNAGDTVDGGMMYGGGGQSW